ncbi:MAG: hypothetical protein HRT37_25850 [Alteromonadaceae bacterium]|nr:hypothetical protein [Alteromonadaceae bacterium]
MNQGNDQNTKTEKADFVIQEEKEHYIDEDFKKHYQKVTGNYKLTEKDLPQHGLALSGGGIRSASFAIGVIQALKEDDPSSYNEDTGDKKVNVLDKISYLSTASGGGYAGSALTWYQRKHGFFPFGKKSTFQGSKNEQNPDKDKENSTLNYIRQNGKYLTPSQLGVSGLAGSLLFSILHSVIAYILLTTLVFSVFMGIVSLDRITSLIPDNVSKMSNELLTSIPIASSDDLLQLLNMSLLMISITSLCFLSIVIIYGFSSFYKDKLARNYACRLRIQRVLGNLLNILIALIILASLPFISQLFLDLKYYSVSFAFISTTSGIIVAMKQFKDDHDSKRSSGVISNLFNSLVAFSVILLLLMVSYLLADFLVSNHISLLPLFLGATFIFVIFVNTNQTSPHKMYRDRLMETFLKDPSVLVNAGLHERGGEANNFLKSSLATKKTSKNQKELYWSPYHIINTNVILNNAKNPKYQGRKGDSFILSPFYCGSDATEYIKTDEFNSGNITLSTAMAISGAALNPNSGVSGVGTTTNPLVSYLLAFFGLRLGYWARNPSGNSIMSKFKLTHTPNYIFPGIMNLLKFGHKEDSTFVELSDGGHFDNTGIYELVRRRLKVIILSDGSADPNMDFDDFGNAIQRIRVDFGVRITFDTIENNTKKEPGFKWFDLDGMLPFNKQAPEKHDGDNLFASKFNLSKRGYAIGEIRYPALTSKQGKVVSEAFIGKFILIKPVLIPTLPRDIFAYCAANPDFPNQPTSDQFFDERQFESYRELGYQLTKELLQEPEARKHLN